MYVIINKKTGQFVYGTDYRQRYNNGIAKQRISYCKALTYESLEEAECDKRNRKMSKHYEVAEAYITIIPPGRKK